MKMEISNIHEISIVTFLYVYMYTHMFMLYSKSEYDTFHMGLNIVTICAEDIRLLHIRKFESTYHQNYGHINSNSLLIN